MLRRRLATTDSNVRASTPGTAQPVLWAHGAGTVGYHGANRGKLLIDFGKAAPETVAQVECADYYSVDLRTGNLTFPAVEAAYACQSIELPVATDAHVVGFVPIIDKESVHHILVHNCSTTRSIT